MKLVIPTEIDACTSVPVTFPSMILVAQCQKLNLLHNVAFFFQPGTPNPIAELSMINLEDAINGKPISVQLQPPQDLLKRYYIIF
jgi:hypothetical protein